MCVCICLYMVVTHHIGLVFFLLWFCPINTVFTNKLSFRSSSWAEQCFMPGEYFQESKPVMHCAFGGETRKKVLRKRTKGAVGKPNRQGSTQVLNEFVCWLVHFLARCVMLFSGVPGICSLLVAAFEEHHCFWCLTYRDGNALFLTHLHR